jgi:hypothetical protein
VPNSCLISVAGTAVLAAEWSRELEAVPPDRCADRMLELKEQLIEELRYGRVAEAVLQAQAIRVSITVYRMRMARRRRA